MKIIPGVMGPWWLGILHVLQTLPCLESQEVPPHILLSATKSIAASEGSKPWPQLTDPATFFPASKPMMNQPTKSLGQGLGDYGNSRDQWSFLLGYTESLSLDPCNQNRTVRDFNSSMSFVATGCTVSVWAKKTTMHPEERISSIRLQSVNQAHCFCLASGFSAPEKLSTNVKLSGFHNKIEKTISQTPPTPAL